MNITKLDIGGAYYIEAKRHADERGWFQEWFKKSDLQQHIDFDFTPVQANISHSKKGVIRGIHYSIAPEGQAKLVTVMHGAIDDYIIDINPNSANFGKWTRVRLTSQDGNAVLLPPHVGHAFQSLSDNTMVCYIVTAEFNPKVEMGITPKCNAVNIHWDTRFNSFISKKDADAPTLLSRLDTGGLPSFPSSSLATDIDSSALGIHPDLETTYQMMIIKDELIGLHAKNQELVHRIALSDARHQSEITSIKQSWTWKIGTYLLRPIRFFKHLR
jgi:dTDP-4-dehydrorhamnose 3,5-epimerase